MIDQIAAPRGVFLPKLVTTLREGYGLTQLRADLLAGLTVAIVALPLSMAIAIASGVEPQRGLYTAIVGGLLVSVLGGSRFQIGGPAGAFIVVVAATVAAHGVDGLILATLLSGLMLVAAGLLGLGTYIKFIPYPVTVGFTAGIAAIIFASQIVPLLGLTLPGPEPGPLLEKVPAIRAALPTLNPATLGLSLAAIAALVALKRLRPHWPRMLIVVALAALAVWALGLPVATIGSAFGGIPQGFPAPALPVPTLDQTLGVLPNALTFALLGAIESLLSAVVADGMTGRRHRSNMELVAQGIANVGSALFGGFCVTGTIARTATNVRAGAHGPVAGMAHAGFLLVFVLVAAPLAGYVPLAALAAVLAVVAWDMVEKPAFRALLATRGDAAVLLVTLGLTLFRDRGRPAPALLVEGAQELRRVGGRPLRIEHVLEAREGVPVPAVVDLHAADVEARAPRRHARLGERQRLLAALKPEPLALAIHRPGIRSHPPVPVAPGLGEGHRVQHLGGHSAPPRPVHDRLLAERRRPLLVGARRRDRGRERERKAQPEAGPGRHARDFPQTADLSGLGSRGYQWVSGIPLLRTRRPGRMRAAAPDLA